MMSPIMEIGKMDGDLTQAFMETIGTMWDSEEETNMTNMDIRAINYFLYIENE